MFTFIWDHNVVQCILLGTIFSPIFSIFLSFVFLICMYIICLRCTCELVHTYTSKFISFSGVYIHQLHHDTQYTGPIYRLVPEWDHPAGAVAAPLPCRLLHRLQGTVEHILSANAGHRQLLLEVTFLKRSLLLFRKSNIVIGTLPY